MTMMIFQQTLFLLLVTLSSASAGYCNWGPLGTGASSTCDLDVQGGAWCNKDQSSCETSCGGRWCTNDEETGGGTGGGGGTVEEPKTGGSDECPTGWTAASWTWYQSYAPCCRDSPNYDPLADTTECVKYSACSYTGSFAYIGQRSYDYVANNDLIAFFSSNGDNNDYARKKIRVSAMGKTIETLVADTCGDSDCNGCCSANADSKTGYLVDMEAQTVARHFGSTSNAYGTVCFQVLPDESAPKTGYCSWSGCSAGSPPQGGNDYCDYDSVSCEGSCSGTWCALQEEPEEPEPEPEGLCPDASCGTGKYRIHKVRRDGRCVNRCKSESRASFLLTNRGFKCGACSS